MSDTADTVSDRIEVDGITSKPLSEGDAKSIASDFKRDGEVDPDAYGLNTESFIEWSDIFSESGSAALNAVAFSAALTAAPHVYRIVAQYMQSGQLDARLIREGAGQVLASSSGAGLRGGLAAVITGSCKAGLMGQSLKGSHLLLSVWLPPWRSTLLKILGDMLKGRSPAKNWRSTHQEMLWPL